MPRNWTPDILNPYPARPTPLGPEVPQPGPQAPPGPQPYQPYQPSGDELSRYVELGVLTEEEAENLRQQKRAEASMAAAGPEGRMVGRVYVAAHPLEHLAGLAGRFGAKQRLDQLRREREALVNQRRAGLRAEQDIGQQTLGYPAPFGF